MLIYNHKAIIQNLKYAILDVLNNCDYWLPYVDIINLIDYKVFGNDDDYVFLKYAFYELLIEFKITTDDDYRFLGGKDFLEKYETLAYGIKGKELFYVGEIYDPNYEP